MTTRYASALAEIRALLASRTQADPTLDARDVWEELTCYPVPSLRTVRRLMEQIRDEAGFGRHGQPNATGRRGQTAPRPVGSNYRMTTKELWQKFDELERRTQCFVDLDSKLMAELDAAATKRGTDRHSLTRFAMRQWLSEHPFRSAESHIDLTSASALRN